MKKSKKLFAALVAACMLLSLTPTTLALTEADPNECPYCGVGTYRSVELYWVGVRLKDPVKCTHGWANEHDGMLQDVYSVVGVCTNPACSIYEGKPHSGDYKYKYVDRRYICTHEYQGMSLDDVVS